MHIVKAHMEAFLASADEDIARLQMNRAISEETIRDGVADVETPHDTQARMKVMKAKIKYHKAGVVAGRAQAALAAARRELEIVALVAISI